MVGIKFLFRTLLFLVAVGAVSIVVVFIWYTITKAIMWVVDRVEESNSDFAVWLQPKLRTLIKKKNKE